MITLKYENYANRIEKSLWTTAKKAVEKSVKLANRTFIKNISLTCHTLEDLAELDHPYATRHKSTGKGLHTPNWLIHTQSGKVLEESIKEPEMIETTDGPVANFGFEPDPVPIYLTSGTRKMIPRPVVQGTLGSIKDKVGEIIKGEFAARYKSNVGVSVK